MLLAQRDIEKVLEDPQTPPRLREQLELTQRVRLFGRSLGLEVGEQYTSYLAWPGDRIVTTLVVTRRDEIDAHPFRFPIVGRVPYKGFFDIQRAEAEALEFRQRGFDTCLRPVSAYSTLGFFNDPLSAPMLNLKSGRLIELLLHEFVHATVFVKSQPDFNEGVAQFFGQQASILFLAQEPEAARLRENEIEDEDLLNDLLLSFRSQLKGIYARSATTTRLRSRERKDLESATRVGIAKLPLTTRDASILSRKIDLGNACLALLDTYSGQRNRFEDVLELLEGDLSAFIRRLRFAAKNKNPAETFLDIENFPAESSQSP